VALLGVAWDAAVALAMTPLAGDWARRGARMTRRRAALLIRAAGLMVIAMLCRVGAELCVSVRRLRR
jgi:hypothetical protein